MVSTTINFKYRESLPIDRINQINQTNQTNQISDGSIKHSGDVVSGREGSTEVIRIDLPRLSPQIQAMGISITCYSASKGDSFQDVETAEVGLWDAVNKQ